MSADGRGRVGLRYPVDGRVCYPASRMISRLARCVAVVAVASLTSAAAPLDPAARRCLNGYNERLRQVSSQAGRSAWSCVRSALRGGTQLDACVAGDRGGAIAARQVRVAQLFDAGICRGDEPLQRGAATGNAAHRQAAIDLARDVFADPLAPLGGGAGDRACIDAAAGQTVLGLSAVVGAHRQCMARGLRQGTITGEQTLSDVCGARAQLDQIGRLPEILARAAGAVTAACAGRNTSGLFPGLDLACHANPGALAACIERAAACRACLAVEASNWTPIVDGSGRCDQFDDGESNRSCGDFPFPPAALCRLADDSRFLLASIGLPLSLTIQGGVRIGCAAPGADGRAECRCDLDGSLTRDPAIVIPGVGDLCIAPHDGCATGAIDCDGGSAVDVDLAVDHAAGACVDHADCAANCAAACTARGAGYTVTGAACEGRCLGGAADGATCTLDSQCPLGHCVGRDPVGHAGTCNCSCQGTALGPPAGAGALGCQLGLRLHVELPSDGVCRGPVTFVHPPFCAALTTGAADALISDANNLAGVTIDQLGPGVPHGAAIACADLATGRMTGLELVGSAAVLDSTLGDFLTTFAVVCD